MVGTRRLPCEPHDLMLEPGRNPQSQKVLESESRCTMGGTPRAQESYSTWGLLEQLRARKSVPKFLKVWLDEFHSTHSKYVNSTLYVGEVMCSDQRNPVGWNLCTVCCGDDRWVKTCRPLYWAAAGKDSCSLDALVTWTGHVPHVKSRIISCWQRL